MDDQDDIANERVREALRLAAGEGLEVACRFIETAGEPVAVAMAYKDVAQALYRNSKDVPGMIDAGRRGIAFAFDQAAAMTDAPATAARLKEIAWMMSFNLGANTWPGWGDEGIDISPDQRKAGHDVAMLSLRLVEELSLGATRLGKSCWLVGAHHIANGDAEAALAALDRAANAFAAAGDRPSELMVQGYRAIARKLRPPDRAAAQAELDQVQHHLAQTEGAPAKFYQKQLAVADRILCSGES